MAATLTRERFAGPDWVFERKLDGVRLLSRKTVATMTADQNARVAQPSRSHAGFGLGVSVRLDHAGGALAGSIGEFGWSGAATTYVSIDPQEQMISILLTQHLPFNQPGIFSVFSTMVNGAVVGPARPNGAESRLR